MGKKLRAAFARPLLMPPGHHAVSGAVVCRVDCACGADQWVEEFGCSQAPPQIFDFSC